MSDKKAGATVAKLQKELDNLYIERDCWREVVRVIANDGCGLQTTKDESCRDVYPNDRSEWCWCCVARAAAEDINTFVRSNE